ncbi:uncharacterized protein LOC131632553 [Vicia villosa]|uniref:uncharacterized protein LOC131632553 n=1 Tax=Vicia villosa TaxID=3911 RepID=UPI00273BF360|nr:uncharacterized protein LOC131632553 [Vicia villosa]
MMYKSLQGRKPSVPWRGVCFGNGARPRATFILWLACRNRLPTKDRICKFGVQNDEKCIYCGEKESCQHLFFECRVTRLVWLQVLKWLKIHHMPHGWDLELVWISKNASRSNGRSRALQIAIAEAVYVVWSVRNHKIFQEDNHMELDSNQIIQNIKWRMSGNPKLEAYCHTLDNE